MAANAPVPEVRAALDRAEAEMPRDGEEFTWGGSIGAEARYEQALLWARIGEMDRALRLLEGIDQAAYSWAQVLGPDLPPDVLDQLIDVATGVLSADEMRHLRAQTASRMLWEVATYEATDAQRDWAVATAKAVVEEVDLRHDGTVLTCRSLAYVGRKSGDGALERAAPDCMGQAALLSRDSEALLMAAGAWLSYEAR